MYLSKITLDPAHPQARRDLGDVYEMHRTLARAFAADAGSKPERFLWRAEPNGSSLFPSATLLVQSDVPAAWSVVEGVPGYARKVLGNKAVDLDRLVTNGARYRFRLRANPTVTREGKRHGLVREEEQRAWLERQAEKHGFGLLGWERLQSERLRVKQRQSGRLITVHAVLFEGVLTTNDAERVRQAVLGGLGHGKAWGLGLLSLARHA